MDVAMEKLIVINMTLSYYDDDIWWRQNAPMISKV